MSDLTVPPELQAIIDYVDTRCQVAIGEASGYYNSRTANEMKGKIDADFVAAMNKLTPTEG